MLSKIDIIFLAVFLVWGVWRISSRIRNYVCVFVLRVGNLENGWMDFYETWHVYCIWSNLKSIPYGVIKWTNFTFQENQIFRGFKYFLSVNCSSWRFWISYWGLVCTVQTWERFASIRVSLPLLSFYYGVVWNRIGFNGRGRTVSRQWEINASVL